MNDLNLSLDTHPITVQEAGCVHGLRKKKNPCPPVPVIICGGFCNWSVSCAVLGFWNETVHFFFTESSRPLPSN